MKLWANTVPQLRDIFNDVRESMQRDGKPRQVVVTIPVNKRSLEQNALLHAIFTQIRKHLFANGMGYVEYEDEASGAMVRAEMDDEFVKDWMKDSLGVVVVMMEIRRPLPTRKYTWDQMTKFIHRIDAYCATDLGLQIEYKKRLKSIEEKYREQEDARSEADR